MSIFDLSTGTWLLLAVLAMFSFDAYMMLWRCRLQGNLIAVLKRQNEWLKREAAKAEGKTP